MEIIRMPFSQIAPCLRFIDRVRLSPSVPPVLKTCYDNRIQYIAGGKGALEIAGRLYPCQEGDLFYWPPATPYRVERDKEDPAVIIQVCFDFVKVGHPPIPPFVRLDAYRSELATQRIHFIGKSLFNEPFKLQKFYAGEDLLQVMVQQHVQQRIHYSELSDGLLKALLMLIAQRGSLSGEKKSSPETADRLIAYIHSHLGEPLDNINLGRALHFHPNSVNRIMVSATGVSLHRYVLRAKIHKAAELLSTEGLTVTETAQALGFSDISHFSRTFKRLTGKTPSAVIEQL